jgi:uncharacterized membrane protein
MLEEFWWIFPVVMIMLCFFMMRGRSVSMMCGFGSVGKDKHFIRDPNSVMEILEKRYALGEIDRSTYEEIKSVLNH